MVGVMDEYFDEVVMLVVQLQVVGLGILGYLGLVVQQCYVGLGCEVQYGFVVIVVVVVEQCYVVWVLLQLCLQFVGVVDQMLVFQCVVGQQQFGVLVGQCQLVGLGDLIVVVVCVQLEVEGFGVVQLVVLGQQYMVVEFGVDVVIQLDLGIVGVQYFIFVYFGQYWCGGLYEVVQLFEYQGFVVYYVGFVDGGIVVVVGVDDGVGLLVLVGVVVGYVDGVDGQCVDEVVVVEYVFVFVVLVL